MRDIENPDDIQLLVDLFYKKVVGDVVIGHFFTSVVALSWQHHIPVINSFWCSILLGAGTYSGNPLAKHIEMNRLQRIEQHHFERWLFLWEATIRENFVGHKAEEAISRAKSIAQIMQARIGGS